MFEASARAINGRYRFAFSGESKQSDGKPLEERGFKKSVGALPQEKYYGSVG